MQDKGPSPGLLTDVEIDPQYTVTRETIKETTSQFKTKIRLQQEPIDETRKIVKMLEQIAINQ